MFQQFVAEAAANWDTFTAGSTGTSPMAELLAWTTLIALTPAILALLMSLLGALPRVHLASQVASHPGNDAHEQIHRLGLSAQIVESGTGPRDRALRRGR